MLALRTVTYCTENEETPAHLLHIVGFGQPMAERMRGRDPGAQGHTLGIDRQAIMSKMAAEKQRSAGNSQIAPL